MQARVAKPGQCVKSFWFPWANVPLRYCLDWYPIVSDESGFFELSEVSSGDLKFVHRANPHFKITGLTTPFVDNELVLDEEQPVAISARHMAAHGPDDQNSDQ